VPKALLDWLQVGSPHTLPDMAGYTGHQVK
jgi:hypothetical protein